MRIKISFFLLSILINVTPLFAYDVNVIKLSDFISEPLPESVSMKFLHSIKSYRSKPEHQQVATVTLSFFRGDIGQDEEAVIILLKKECAKLGADITVYISGTIYKDTEEIASKTVRCISSKPDNTTLRRLRAEEAIKKLGASLFFQKFSKHLEMLGETRGKNKVVIRNNKYFDLATNTELTDEAGMAGVNIEWFSEKIISFYRENFELYLSENEYLHQLFEKYPDILSGTDLYPNIKSDGTIDYLKFKVQIEKYLKLEK